jgi:hypothetical protein
MPNRSRGGAENRLYVVATRGKKSGNEYIYDIEPIQGGAYLLIRSDKIEENEWIVGNRSRPAPHAGNRFNKEQQHFGSKN